MILLEFQPSVVIGETIECEFGLDYSLRYTCVVENLEIFNGTRVTIDWAQGAHKNGFSNDDVEKIIINEAPNLNLFPSNLDKVFNNLTEIYMRNSSLQEITQSDLKPFVNLNSLYLAFNKIKTLGENIFKFNPHLFVITVFRNQISEIDPSAFDGLDGLEVLFVGDNKCKTKFEFAETRAEVIDVINRIKAGECALTVAEKEAKKLEQLTIISQ